MLNKTESGHDEIKISYLKRGEGPVPKPYQRVSIHYELALSKDNLAQGFLVDSSYARRQTVEFEVCSGAALKGIDIAVSQMKVGDLCRVQLPPRLAFGERGVKGLIPPNSTLFVDLKLRFIEDKPLNEVN